MPLQQCQNTGVIRCWLLFVFRRRRRWMVWLWVFCWVIQSNWTTTDSMTPLYLFALPDAGVTRCLVQTGQLLMLRPFSITWPSAGVFLAVCLRLPHSWNIWRCQIALRSSLMGRCFCTPFAGCHVFLIRLFRCVEMWSVLTCWAVFYCLVMAVIIFSKLCAAYLQYHKLQFYLWRSDLTTVHYKAGHAQILVAKWLSAAATVIFGDWKFICWQAYNPCTVGSLLWKNQGLYALVHPFNFSDFYCHSSVLCLYVMCIMHFL